MSSIKSPRKIIYRINKGIASSKPGAWFFSRALPHLDRPVFRLSKGKHSAASILTGLPLIMLTTTGAKSGKARTVPLLAISDDDKLILIASNWGQTRYPSWYYNLRANPKAVIAIQGQSAQWYEARETTDAEWDHLWQKAVNTYAGYAAYKGRIEAANNRHIPILLMSPIPDKDDKAKRHA